MSALPTIAQRLATPPAAPQDTPTEVVGAPSPPPVNLRVRVDHGVAGARDAHGGQARRGARAVGLDELVADDPGGVVPTAIHPDAVRARAAARGDDRVAAHDDALGLSGDVDAEALRALSAAQGVPLDEGRRASR